jgi:GPI-anchor transamidase subunit S
MLLGITELRPELRSDSRISEWQLDTLYRKRAAENAVNSRETLESIIKLVDQIPNMPVDSNVKLDFQAALDALENVRVFYHSITRETYVFS